MQKEENVDFKQPNVLILTTTRECAHSINHEIIQRNKEFSKRCRRGNITYSISEAKIDLYNIEEDEKLFDRMIKVASIITSLMEGKVKQSDMPIIVGGLSLEIYTESEYTTHDIDLVTSASNIIEDNLLEMDLRNKAEFLYMNI